MNELPRYPLDFDALKRGDSLSAADVEKALDMARTDEHYWRKLLDLKTMIEEHFIAGGDNGIVVTTRDDGIQILTHEQAAPYLQKRERDARRLQFRTVAKAQFIDRNQLTEATREAHDRWMIVATHRLLMQRTRPKLSDNGHDRSRSHEPIKGHGGAARGMESPGRARRGVAWNEVRHRSARARPGEDGPGQSRLVGAWQGRAWNLARQGTARRVPDSRGSGTARLGP